jgi:hypothetical protein
VEVARPFVIAEGAVLGLARDGTHLWWITADAIHRRPLGGPDAAAIERIEHVSQDPVRAFAAHDGVAYVATSRAVHAVTPDGDVRPIAEAVGVRDLAVDARGVYAADDSGVWRIDGGGVRLQLVRAADVSAVELAGDRLYRVQDRDVVVSTTDGAPVTTLPLAPGALAVDGERLVVRTALFGELLERDGTGALRVHGWPEGPWLVGSGSVVAAGEWLYAEVAREGGGAALLAVPRAAAAPVVLETGGSYVEDVEVDRGELFWTVDHQVRRGDPATGRSEVLLAESSLTAHLEVGPEWIHVAGDSGVARLPRAGGALEPLDDRGHELAVSGDAVAWLSGAVLRVWRDGRAVDVAQLTDLSWIGDLELAEDHAIIGSRALYRVDERGSVEIVDDGLGRIDRRAVVASGDEVYVLTARGVYLLRDDGPADEVLAAPAGDVLDGLVGCEGRLYAITARSRVIRIDPAGPDATVMRIGPRGALPATGALACDGEALYVVVAGAQRIVRVPHDAPALPWLD